MTERRWRTLGRAICKTRDLRTMEKLVCFTIIAEANLERTGEFAFLSMSEMMDRTSLSRASVAKTVKRLEALGWISVTRTTAEDGGLAPNAYRVTPPRPA